MESDCRGHIDRSPSHQLATPRKIRILTVSEKVFIEELARDCDVVQRLHAIERRWSTGPENILRLVELSPIGSIGAAIEMPLAAQHDNPGRIESLAIHSKKLARG